MLSDLHKKKEILLKRQIAKHYLSIIHEQK